MNSLTGKVAIVTGGSKGIGAGIARGLASAGAAVAVNYSSDRAGAERVVTAIREAGGRALAVQGDVAKGADVERLFAETAKELGPPSIVVNNAGVYRFDPIEQVTEDEFRREFDTNVLGTLLVSREAAKTFPAAGGSIVNISSVASTAHMPGASVYSATKAALDAVTRSLAAELGPRKIRVNTVAPGPVDTEGSQAAGVIGSDFEKAMVAQTPLGRIAKPDDIAPVVVFLASDDAGWLTGERVSASGGLH
ncbi:MAG TPA: glucose 1-dehydrogenase [Candidatus Sulfotelmatobacter sp.]|nr:glucose 1-dehydrogenase [Candidatus Sulfotelmatobacter sp.]